MNQWERFFGYLFLPVMVAIVVYSSIDTQDAVAPYKNEADSAQIIEIIGTVDDLQLALSNLQHQQREMAAVLAALGATTGTTTQVPSVEIDSLEDIESRLDVIENEIRKIPNSNDGFTYNPTGRRLQQSQFQEATDINYQDPTVFIDFAEDDELDPAARIDRENVDSILDQDEFSSLDFAGMHCKESYCRLDYSERFLDRASAEIAENELLIQLGQKYGDGVVFHHASNGEASKSIYVEFSNN